MTESGQAKTGVRIWDLPTRLFHWLLVALIVLLYASGEFGLLDMRWHFWLGYTTLALIVFRVLWGLFGSQTSRFAAFLRGPKPILRYLRTGSADPHVGAGHNPLGGWSVIALLLSVLVQCVSGLFSSDEIDTDGPLAGMVSGYTVKLMTRVHNWNENVLLFLVALHVVAVLFYLLARHDNLIVPMFTGVKQQERPSSELRFASNWLALALALLSVAAVAALVWSAN